MQVNSAAGCGRLSDAASLEAYHINNLTGPDANVQHGAVPDIDPKVFPLPEHPELKIFIGNEFPGLFQTVYDGIDFLLSFFS